jgi:hypothetical protein
MTGEVIGIAEFRFPGRLRRRRSGTRTTTRAAAAGRSGRGMGGRHTALGWVLLFSVTSGAAACTNPAAISEEADAAIYATVIRWFAAGVDPTNPVFLDGQAGVEIELAVQADVLRLLDDLESARFIDALAEAVDETAPGAPVRDNGILVRLGPISDGESVSVAAGQYVSADETTTYTFTLGRHRGVWEIEGSPEPVQDGG